jgi:hypothetical protein
MEKTRIRRRGVVGLMTAKGVEGFYSKYGFIERPTQKYGVEMMLFW